MANVCILNRDIWTLFFYYVGQSKLPNVTVIWLTHCIICGKEVSDTAKRDSFHSLITDVIVLCSRTLLLLFINRNLWEEFTVYF